MKKLLPFILGAVALPMALLSCAFDAELPENGDAEDAESRALLKTIATAPAMYDYVCLNYGNAPSRSRKARSKPRGRPKPSISSRFPERK